jgi:hypothetical protein
MNQPETIPFYLADDFVARLAFSLWSYARYVGTEPLHELGSWAMTKESYLEQARYVAEDLDRLGS